MRIKVFFLLVESNETATVLKYIYMCNICLMYLCNFLRYLFTLFLFTHFHHVLIYYSPKMKSLAPSEVACVHCRLGLLNCYNPCKPEGAWELDMARREERVLAKTLCVLATNEPGDNWVHNTFRWMRSMDSMPGWELVSSEVGWWWVKLEYRSIVYCV